eukprot:1032636-Pelagomonas_calceolata.AAC.2
MVAVMEGDEIGPFNVGNPNEFTMLELANLVKELWIRVLFLKGLEKTACKDVAASLQSRGKAKGIDVGEVPSAYTGKAKSKHWRGKISAGSEPQRNDWILGPHIRLPQVVNPSAMIEFRDNTSDDPNKRKGIGPLLQPDLATRQATRAPLHPV